MMIPTLKKAVLTFACLGIGASVSMGDMDKPKKLRLVGELDTVYKMQTDYRTPLDSRDPLNAVDIDAGFDQRDGANNRSSQNVRTTGSLTMIGQAQENQTSSGNQWYGLTGILKFKMDAQDPDFRSDEKLDGAYKDKVDLGDVWIRYAPKRNIGIKVGVQSVAATANASGIGHKFMGDPDEDFIYYTSAALLSKPGVTVDVHLSKKISFGIGQLQGMGDLSALTAGGSSAQAKNNVAWFSGGFGLVDLNVGYQDISVGGTETDGDGVQGIWKHEYKHTLINWMARFNVGKFSPFIGQQLLTGDKTSAGASFESYDSAMQSLAALGAQRLNNRGGERGVEMAMTTVGLVASLGKLGKIAAEYTTGTTPEWGESKNAAVASELGSIMQINYVYPLSKRASLTIFYNAMNAVEDSKLRDDVDTATANNAKIDTAASMNAITSAQQASLKQMPDSMDIYKWSSSTSMGIALNMKFGN